MIKIIDATLGELDQFQMTGRQIMKMIELIAALGIKDFLLSEKVYKTVGNSLPDTFRYYMELPAVVCAIDYPKIQRFIIPHELSGSPYICGYQVNDIREVIKLRSFTGCPQILLRGFDDILCHDYQGVFKNIHSILKQSEIILCPQNTFYTATAIAVTFLQGAGQTVMTSFTGIGNHAATEQVILALRTIVRYKVNQDLLSLKKLSLLFNDIIERKPIGVAPVIGDRIFYVESGVHVDGIIKNPTNYETYPPEVVGHKREIILGKHSGRSSITWILQQLGLNPVSDDMERILLKKVKEKSIFLGRGITTEEFLRLVKEVLNK